MPSLFTDDEKAQIETLFDSIHDTYKRTVYLWKKESTVANLASNDNPLYDRDSSTPSGLESLVKYEISARIWDAKWNKEELLDDTGLTSSEGVLRLKVDSTSLELLKNAVVVEVDGESYSIVSNSHFVGPFLGNYFKVYLKRNV